MHILIYEPNHKGHRFTTVRVLIDALLALEESAGGALSGVHFATTREGLESEQFTEQLSSIAGRIHLVTLPEMPLAAHPAKAAWHRLKAINTLLNSNQYDHVFFPYADAVLQLLTVMRFLPIIRWWPGRAHTEAMIMNSSYAYPFARWSRRWLSEMAVRYSGCSVVHLNDPIAYQYVVDKKINSDGHIRLMPDPISATPVHDKKAVREALGLPVESHIVGCVGLINRRKGADKLIEAFVAAGLGDSARLLLAGQFAADIREQVQALDDPRIICFDYYLTELQLTQVISALDLVATPYPEIRGSGSVIIRAALAGRMVLSSNTAWANYIVNRFELGKTVAISDTAGFATAMTEALEQAPYYTPSEAAKNYAGYNSQENIRAHWTAYLRERLGMQPNDEMLRWESVDSRDTHS